MSMPILGILFMGRGGRFKPTNPRGSVMGSKGVGTHDARGWFYNLTRWDHGGGHVRPGSHMVPSGKSLEVNLCNLNC